MREARSSPAKAVLIVVGAVLAAVAVAAVFLTAPTAEDRCAAAPAETIEAIASGLTPPAVSLRADGAAQVTANEYEQDDSGWPAAFIAAEIDGPGIEASGQVGVWAVGGPGPIVAVTPAAQQYSSWQAVADGSPEVVSAELAATEAARAAEQCAR